MTAERMTKESPRRPRRAPCSAGMWKGRTLPKNPRPSRGVKLPEPGLYMQIAKPPPRWVAGGFSTNRERVKPPTKLPSVNKGGSARCTRDNGLHMAPSAAFKPQTPRTQKRRSTGKEIERCIHSIKRDVDALDAIIVRPLQGDTAAGAVDAESSATSLGSQRSSKTGIWDDLSQETLVASSSWASLGQENTPRRRHAKSARSQISRVFSAPKATTSNIWSFMRHLCRRIIHCENLLRKHLRKEQDSTVISKFTSMQSKVKEYRKSLLYASNRVGLASEISALLDSKTTAGGLSSSSQTLLSTEKFASRHAQLTAVATGVTPASAAYDRKEIHHMLDAMQQQNEQYVL